MSAHMVRQLLGARLTIALVLIWLLVEVVRFLFFAQTEAQSNAFYMKVGLSRGGLQSLHLWQPLTYSFVHAGWVHVLMNLFLLLAVGMRLEWMLGRRSLGWLLLSGILVGAAFHLVLSWDFQREIRIEVVGTLPIVGQKSRSWIDALLSGSDPDRSGPWYSRFEATRNGTRECRLG